MDEDEPVAPAAPAAEPLDAPGDGAGDEVSAFPEISVDDLQVEVSEGKDRYLRLAADFDNYRKRVQREKAELLSAATDGVVAELLPVVDNLERALAASQGGAGGSDGAESIRKGVELTLRMFHGVLNRFGVEKMSAAGEPFDPHRHEALSQAESADVPADTVGEVFEPGYIARGRVIRPARVQVLKPLSSSEGG